MYELAGIVGIDPGPLTLRQLLWMAEARMRQTWSHTSSVLAMIANVNRDPKKKPSPFNPADFNPYGRKRKPGVAVTAQNMGILKRVFVDKHVKFLQKPLDKSGFCCIMQFVRHLSER